MSDRGGIRRVAHTISTGPEDDAAFRALHDLAVMIAAEPEARVIGGHMVGLLAAAFPSPGLIPRVTGDADAGISLELAGTGTMHDGLLAGGYTPQTSNRYVRGTAPDEQVIDLLVPTFTGKFTDSERAGGRVFNGMPGLTLAFDDPIVVEAHLTLRDGTELVSDIPLPRLEAAVVLKTYAWRDRAGRTPKDTIDLSNLLHILDEHGPGPVGGWTLDTGERTGARGDAAALLLRLASRARSGRATPPAVDARKLEVLIRRWVAV